MPRLFGYLLGAWNKTLDILTGFSAGRVAPLYRPAASLMGYQVPAE